MYIFSKFSTYNTNAQACVPIHIPHPHHTHTYTHTLSYIRAVGLKRKVFKEDFRGLTEVE